jgi:hypothetical protein
LASTPTIPKSLIVSIIIVIITIIMTGKNSPVWATAFLRRSASRFHLFGFRSSKISTEQGK